MKNIKKIVLIMDCLFFIIVIFAQPEDLDNDDGYDDTYIPQQSPTDENLLLLSINGTALAFYVNYKRERQQSILINNNS